MKNQSLKETKTTKRLNFYLLGLLLSVLITGAAIIWYKFCPATKQEEGLVLLTLSVLISLFFYFAWRQAQLAPEMFKITEDEET